MSASKPTIQPPRVSTSSVGYSPDAKKIVPLWRGTPINGAVLPAVGSYHPEVVGLTPAGELDIFGRYGLTLPIWKGDQSGQTGQAIAGPYIQGLSLEDFTAYSAIARGELIAKFPGKGEPAWYEICDYILAENLMLRKKPQASTQTSTQVGTQAQSQPQAVQGTQGVQVMPAQGGQGGSRPALGTASGSYPLTPSDVRADELGPSIVALINAILPFIPPTGASQELRSLMRPFLVAGIKLYRRLMHYLGDPRALPD